MYEHGRGWRILDPMREPRVEPAVCAYYDLPSEDDTVMGAQVYAFGGATTLGRQLASVERYDPPNDKWFYCRPMQCARVGAFACCTGRYIYVCGGVCGATTLNSVERFDTETNTWVFVAPMKVARSVAAGALVDGKIFVAGGRGTGSRCLHSVEMYDEESDTWVARAPMPEPTDAAAAGATPEGLLLVAGGFSPELSDDGFVYDTRKDRWHKSRVHMPCACHGVGGAALAGLGGLVVTGGHDMFGCRRDVLVWDVAGRTWSELPPLLSKRANHAAVTVSGHELPLLRAMEADVEIKRMLEEKLKARRYKPSLSSQLDVRGDETGVL